MSCKMVMSYKSQKAIIAKINSKFTKPLFGQFHQIQFPLIFLLYSNCIDCNNGQCKKLRRVENIIEITLLQMTSLE